MKQMSVFLADLQGRDMDITAAQNLRKACFLDPKFKSLTFSEDTTECVVLAIEEEAMVIKNLAAAEDERNEVQQKGLS